MKLYKELALFLRDYFLTFFPYDYNNKPWPKTKTTQNSRTSFQFPVPSWSQSWQQELEAPGRITSKTRDQRLMRAGAQFNVSFFFM